MHNYLALATKYLTSHKKKTRLSILSVIMSVALVVGIFSMLDVLLQFEKVQVIHDYGNYHILIKNATLKEESAIANRIDVENTGTWISLKSGNINGAKCDIVAVDENFAPNMSMNLWEGSYPQAANELMIESWAAEKLGLKPGDTISLTFNNNEEKSFVLSGIFSDYGSTKAEGTPGVVISIKAAQMTEAEKESCFLVQFKDKAKILKAIADIEETLQIPDSNIGRNERLLAVIGQTDYKAAVGLYKVGAILFVIVLVAGIVMIYNTFNISVMERIRQFGLLRCIGASKSQIKKIVKREGFLLLRWAIPLGIVIGIFVTTFCCAILKYFNRYIFGDIPLFNISSIGILAGVAVGFFTVVIASSLPAKKAAKVSPLNAVTGSGEIKAVKTQKQGFLTRHLPVETAMGVNNAVLKKKTLVLMSASIAISIIMFLGFNVFVDFMYSSLKTIKPYTPDITLVSDKGLSDDLGSQLSELEGVGHVYGRMFEHVEATFEASRLTEAYKKEVGDIKTNPDGLFTPPEKSWLISYDKQQLKWAKTDLLKGKISEDELNAQNGIIAIAITTRKGINAETANLKLGDKVYIKTPSGTKEFTVMAILRSVPFNDSQLNLTTFITTEKQFREITGKGTYDAIDVQLRSKNQEVTLSQIKGLIGSDVNYLDARQKNSEIKQTFLTMAVFIYGFVIVIALISVLNIINTMQTSVSSRTRYLGVMRAVGMSAKQLKKMIITEAATYSIIGGIAGIIIGLVVQKLLITNLLTAFHMDWNFPLKQVLIIFGLTLLVTLLSVNGPLKKIRSRGIAENIEGL